MCWINRKKSQQKKTPAVMKRKRSTIQIHLLRKKNSVKTIGQKPVQERLWLYLIDTREDCTAQKVLKDSY